MIEIYGKMDCNSCTAAVQLCKDKNLEYKYYHLDDHYTIMELWAKVKFKTWPQIWVDSEHISGYTELKEKHGS